MIKKHQELRDKEEERIVAHKQEHIAFDSKAETASEAL